MQGEKLLARFTRDPFALREAEREGGVGLDAYFFEHPLFHELLGDAAAPESNVVFAGRGAGKTTLRQALELYCRQGDYRVQGVLAVPYVEFSRPLAAAGSGPVMIHHHIAEILRVAVLAVLETLDEAQAAKVLALPRGDLALFSAYIRAYTPLFTAEDQGQHLHALLRRLARAADAHRPLVQDTSDLLTTADPAALLAAVPAPIRPAAQALRRLYDQAPHALVPLTAPPAGGAAPLPYALPSYLQQLHDFLELLGVLNYQALYVLVDRLDETSLLADESAAVAFIGPLLSDLKLLEEPHLAFKVFLPAHLELPLAPYMRPMRLRVKRLTWSDADLLALLSRRLQQFTRTPVPDLRPFCERALADHSPQPDLPQAPYVDATLVRSAHGLPRLLIWRCRQLFELAAERDPEDQLTEADLTRALRATPPADDPLPLLPPGTPREEGGQLVYQGTGAPSPAPPQGLHLDERGKVWRDGLLLPKQPRPKELKLLRYLYDRRCQICPKEDILLAVWDKIATDTDLNTTLGRLRKTVESDPAHPRYLLTIPGQGLRLVDSSCT